MTALAHPEARPRHLSTRRLAGTGALLRLALRRDRIMIPVWVLALGSSVLSLVSAFEKLYGTAAQRAELARSMSANGSMRALYGPVFSDSVGGLIAWRMGVFTTVLAAVMSLLIVVRHTREEEESGRQELLSAAVVGRRAPLTAALLAACVADAALALLIGAGLHAAGQPAAGSYALGFSVGAVGLVFAGVAGITAQLTESARLAKGLAGALVGLAFVTRAAGDAASEDASSFLVWLSPVGWAENVRAYQDERWWVLLLLLAAAAVACAVGYVLAGRRDIGMSFLATRVGAAEGRLGSPAALAWRLQRGNLLGWCLALAFTGAVFGGVADGAADLVRDNEQTRQIFERMGGQQGITDALLAALTGLFGMIVAIYAVGAVLRLRGEETSQRAEPVLAGPVSRLRWAAGHLVMAFAGSVAVLAVGGLALGVGYGIASGHGVGQTPRVLGAALAQTPAVWVLAGLAVFLYGAVPEAVAAAWTVTGGCLAIGWIGPALDLPQWAMDLSPFGHLAKLPGTAISWPPVIWLTVLAVALTAAGLAGLRRRDLSAG